MVLLILAINTPASRANPMQHNGPVAIGMLASLWAPTDDMLGLRDGLVALGYQSDVDIAFGVRFAAGRDDQLEPILRQLLSHGAHILYVSEWHVLQAARRVTAQTPIVFTTWYPPAPDEIAPESIALGDLVTGVTHAFPDVNPKALERFRALIPTLQRVLVPYDANAPYLAEPLQALRLEAVRLGMRLDARAVRTQAEAKQAIMLTPKAEIDGILPIGGSLNIAGYALQASLQRQIPTLFSRAWMAEYGGLASYGPSWYDLGVQAARLVDQIIQGATPKTLPVKVSQKMQFVINLRTAQKLGITIPADLLSQADEVIR
jgi:putative ABC transport system substrate-binding protein